MGGGPRSESEYRMLWFATQLIDYAFGLCMVYSLTIYSLETYPPADHPLRWALVLFIQGHLAPGLIYLRERVHFVVLGDRVSTFKRGSLTRANWKLIVQTAVFSQASSFIPGLLGMFDFKNTFEWSSSNLIRTYLQFYAMLLLRDLVSMTPFHPLMHTPRWYHLHKTHHEVRRDAQAMHAFHIDLIDLLLENVCGNAILLAGQRAVGLPVQINPFAAALFTCHDGVLHSVNPYSVMYFCPPLDCFLKGNVCHQLHHALNKDYYTFIPFGHVWSRRKRDEDWDRYNSIFKTDFVLR